MKEIMLLIAVVLMIEGPLAQAKKHHLTYTEQESGIASDKVGRVCDFGPSHDECHDPFIERTYNASNDFSSLPHAKDPQAAYQALGIWKLCWKHLGPLLRKLDDLGAGFVQLNLFYEFRASDLVTFGIVYNLIFGLSKVVGILFGIAFWTIARSQGQRIKIYNHCCMDR